MIIKKEGKIMILINRSKPITIIIYLTILFLIPITLYINSILLLVFPAVLLTFILIYFYPFYTFCTLILVYPILFITFNSEITLFNSLGTIPLKVTEILFLALLLRIISSAENFKKIKNKSHLKTCMYMIFIIIFFYITSLTEVVTFSLSKEYIFKLLLSFSLFILSVVLVDSYKKMMIVHFTLSIGVLIQLIVCLYQNFFNFRVFGTFYHDANLTMYLAFYIIFSMYIMFQKLNASLIFNMISLFAAFSILFLAEQRTAFLALLITSIFYFKNKMKFILLIVILFLFLVANSFDLINIYINDFKNQVGVLGNYYTGNSIGWRLNVWSLMIDPIKQNFFYGHGLGSSNSFVGSIYYGHSYTPHNEYIRLMYEVGIIGTIIYLSLFFIILYLSKNRRHYKVILLLIVCYLACMITDNIIIIPEVSMLFFMLIGIYSNEKIIEKEGSYF